MKNCMEKIEGNMWSEAEWREGIEYVIEENRLMCYVMDCQEKKGLNTHSCDELAEIAMKKAKEVVDNKISYDTDISERVKMYGAEAEKILEQAFKRLEAPTDEKNI